MTFPRTETWECGWSMVEEGTFAPSIQVDLQNSGIVKSAQQKPASIPGRIQLAIPDVNAEEHAILLALAPYGAVFISAP